jgi:hypothetical protein
MLMFVVTTFLLVYFFTPSRTINNKGSRELALNWRNELTALADPESAAVRNNGITTRRYSNGEWVMGKCQNSHSDADGGGTVVLKDSRGEIRIYFGHVCGKGALSALFRGGSDLNSLYEYMRNDCQFTEQHFD